MVGQCLFCSWYGIRLRRAPYPDGGRGCYHLHCARVALHSPDPADRARAAQIFRAELARVLRTHFWEVNPPNRTVKPAAGVRELTLEEFDRLCRQHLAGPSDLLRDFLPNGVALRLPETAAAGYGELPRPVIGCGRPSWGYPQRALPPLSSARRLRRTPATWSHAGPRRRRDAQAPVDRALELVRCFSGEEMRQFRERLAGRPLLESDAVSEPGAGTVTE